MIFFLFATEVRWCGGVIFLHVSVQFDLGNKKLKEKKRRKRLTDTIIYIYIYKEDMFVFKSLRV